MALDWNVDSSWTLFLDRDGVINHRIMGGYVTCIEEFKFLEGVLEAFSEFNLLFSNVFIVTNQQGISKGIMEERNLLEVHRYMEDEVLKAKGKITKAKEEFPSIDFSKSIMIGDTDSDIIFGKNLGMKTVRIKTVEPIGIEADLTCLSLKEFSELLNYEK